MLNDEAKDEDEEVLLSPRLIPFIFPPTSFLYPNNRLHHYQDSIPSKRHSFGRKNHWDAFFGRR